MKGKSNSITSISYSQIGPGSGLNQATRESQQAGSLPHRILAFAYGLVAYAFFFGTYLYAIGFIGNFGVPKTLDSSAHGPLGYALLINALLLGVFAVQHSVMARPAFKALWTRIVPQPIERSTYVLFSSLALILMFALWQPIGITIWKVEHPAGRALLYGLFAAGFVIVLVSTFLINHFELFGLRQVYLYLRGREYTPLRFKTPLFYKHVRHPLYVGWLLAFWATHTMTAAHLMFAVATTAYILLAIQWEERDLVAIHGQAYSDYRKRVPMLIPRLAGSRDTARRATAAPTEPAPI